MSANRLASLNEQTPLEVEANIRGRIQRIEIPGYSLKYY
jgi:hypothetical protein